MSGPRPGDTGAYVDRGTIASSSAENATFKPAQAAPGGSVDIYMHVNATSTARIGEDLMTTTATRHITHAYFNAWQNRDSAAFRTPSASPGSRPWPTLLSASTWRTFWADGEDAITSFYVHRIAATPTPMANWTHIHNCKVNSIHVTYALLPRDPVADH